MSLLDSGAVLTSSRVVSYATLAGGLQAFSSAHSDVSAITVGQANDTEATTTVWVTTRAGTRFPVVLPLDAGDAQTFINSLREHTMPGRC